MNGKVDFPQFLQFAELESEKRIKQSLLDNFNYLTDDKYLNFEVKAFSLWLLMLAIPNEKEIFFDSIHRNHFEEGLDSEQIKLIYDQLSTRYEKYTNAYNKWVQNPQNGFYLGGLILSLAKNKEFEISSVDDGYLPSLEDSPLDALKAFAIFATFFEANLKMVSDFRKTI